ncbi:hypothetical protein [Streptomyces sp. NPDC054866]
MKDIFDDSETGDAKKDAVLADNARRLSSVTGAVTVDAPNHPALKFYSSGDALLSAANHVQGYLKKSKSFVGTTRYYDREVTFLKDGAAAVTYCKDTSKTYPKNRKTGKVDRQTTTVLTTTAAKRCMP